MTMLDLETFRLRARGVYPESSIRRKEIVLRKYGEFLEERGLQPGIESLNLWLDELVRRGYSASTVRAYAYDVVSYFELMMVDVDERRLRLLKRRLPPVGARRVDYLTDEEVARLIRSTPSPVRRLIYSIMYAYAKRLGEVLSLTWVDVDLERGTITFRILKKRREERVTYELEPWIKDMLLRYRELLGKDRLFEISTRAVEIAFKKDCRRAGIEPNGRNLRPHILRHSRVTSLREKGVPIDVISKYLARHSRFDTTVQYYRA
ncbi:MAG: site-specific integrase, partial [Thermofilaceae archaeon]